MNEQENQQNEIADLLVIEKALEGHIVRINEQYNAVSRLKESEEIKDNVRQSYLEQEKRAKHLLSETRAKINAY